MGSGCLDSREDTVHLMPQDSPVRSVTLWERLANEGTRAPGSPSQAPCTSWRSCPSISWL